MKPIEEQEIISLMKTYYGIDIQAVQFISGGADINACVYKADAKSTSYFIKFKQGDHDEVNLSIIRLLHDSGIKEIILPILTLEGKLYQQVNHFHVISSPFIPAPNGFIKNLTEKQWKQLGQALHQIHATFVPIQIKQQLRKENYSPKWREMVKSLYNKIGSDITDDKITSDFKSYLKQNLSIIHQLVETAEALSHKIRPNFDTYVLCHADIHAGNVLVAADESIYIIDWDEPILAPKERDLMFIGGGVGNVWNKSDEIHYFYQGYQKTNIDQTILSYYRCERIVEDIAQFAEALLARDQDIQSRLEMFGHFKSMFNPDGVVEIAFAPYRTE